MENNYIKLLVDGCLKLTKNDSLFISYDKINHDFIMNLVSYVKKITGGRSFIYKL